MNKLKIVLVFTAVVAAILAVENRSSSIEDTEEEKHDLDFAESSINVKRAIADYGSNKYDSQHKYNRYEPRSRKSKSRNRRRKSKNKNKKPGFRYNSYQNTKIKDLKDRNLNIVNLNFKNPKNEYQKTILDEQKFEILAPNKENRHFEQTKEISNETPEKAAGEIMSVIENTSPKQTWSTSVPYLVCNTGIKEHDLVSKKIETNEYETKLESKKFELENKPQSQQESTTLDHTKTENNKTISKTNQVLDKSEPIVTTTEHRDLGMKNDNFSKLTNKESVPDGNIQLLLELQNIINKSTSSDSQVNKLDSTAKKTENSVKILPPDSIFLQPLVSKNDKREFDDKELKVLGFEEKTQSEPKTFDSKIEKSKSGIKNIELKSKEVVFDNKSITEYKTIGPKLGIYLADSKEPGHKQENVEQENKKPSKIPNKQNFEKEDTLLKEVNTEIKYQSTKSTPRKADKSKNENSKIYPDHTEIRTETNIQKLKRETTTFNYSFHSEPSTSTPIVKSLEKKIEVEYKNEEVDKKYNKHVPVQQKMEASKLEIKKSYHNDGRGFKQPEPKLTSSDSASRNSNFEEVFLQLRTTVPEDKNIKPRISKLANINSEFKINGLKKKPEEQYYEIILPDITPEPEVKKPKPEYIKPNSSTSKISKPEISEKNKYFKTKINEPKKKIENGYHEIELEFNTQLETKKSVQDAKTIEPQNKTRIPESLYINRNSNATKTKPEYTRFKIGTKHPLRQTNITTKYNMTKTDNIIVIPENRRTKPESKDFNYGKVKFEQDQIKHTTSRARTDAKSKSRKWKRKGINFQYRTSKLDSRYHEDKQEGLKSEYIQPNYPEYIRPNSNYKHTITTTVEPVIVYKTTTQKNFFLKAIEKWW